MVSVFDNKQEWLDRCESLQLSVSPYGESCYNHFHEKVGYARGTTGVIADSEQELADWCEFIAWCAE